VIAQLKNGVGKIVTGFALRHWICAHQSQQAYVKSFLSKGSEAEGGFLQASFGPVWQGYLQQFSAYAAQVAARAHQAGVPVIATLLPNHAQAAMIASGSWPSGYDPYQLGAQLRSIIVGNGGIYVDVLPQFRQLKNVTPLFFPIDGHPTVAGNLVMSRIVASGLEAELPPGPSAPASAGTAP
jgi:hypothetical protein